MNTRPSLRSLAPLAAALGLFACGGSPSSGEASGASSSAVSSAPSHKPRPPRADEDAGTVTDTDAGSVVDSDGGTCAPHDLTGSYTITYNNGVAFTDPNMQNAEIVLNNSSTDPSVSVGADGAPNTSPYPANNIAILQQFDCFAMFAGLDPQYRAEICGTTQIDEMRMVVFGVGNNPTGIGTTTGAVGNEVGTFGPGDTSFTWNYDVPADVWGYAEGGGTVVSATITETGPCEVTYEQLSVRPDFSGFGVAPTAADLVTAKYVLQRK